MPHDAAKLLWDMRAAAGRIQTFTAGKSLADSAKSVTEALTALEGQSIADIRISAVGPGSYGLTIDTDRCQISLRLDRSGVRVENLALGI